MPKIKECCVSTKRTIKLNEQYISFEASLTSDVSDIEDDVVDEHINSLYENLNNIIDNQLVDAIDAET